MFRNFYKDPNEWEELILKLEDYIEEETNGTISHEEMISGVEYLAKLNELELKGELEGPSCYCIINALHIFNYLRPIHEQDITYKKITR